MKASNYVPRMDNLVRPISFPVVVKGAALTATIKAIVDNLHEDEFMIVFSDGYSDSFVVTEEEGTVMAGNRQSGKYYAAAISQDIKSLLYLDANELVWHMLYAIDDELTSIWIRKQKFEDKAIYAVYYKGDYYFHVRPKEGQWFTETCRQVDPQPINEGLAQKVIELLVKEQLVFPFAMA